MAAQKDWEALNSKESTAFTLTSGMPAPVLKQAFPFQSLLAVSIIFALAVCSQSRWQASAYNLPHQIRCMAL